MIPPLTLSNDDEGTPLVAVQEVFPEISVPDFSQLRRVLPAVRRLTTTPRRETLSLFLSSF
jgi:hypothetical protein